ncbi:hypothetical protein WJ966_27365 [Achromobacter xylosoxidans]
MTSCKATEIGTSTCTGPGGSSMAMASALSMMACAAPADMRSDALVIGRINAAWSNTWCV